MKSFSDSYKAAGVDVTAGYRAVDLMKKHVARTKTDGAISSIGGFGGLFQPNLTGMEQPILVSGTDGVGTKLKIAFLLDKHDTIGIDCVAMCVNDVICVGAKPLFFLDYIAVGKNYPEKVAEIVSGIAEGCVQSGCALIGGETAEMPGFYAKDDYDLAGFAVGLADKADVIDGSRMQAGDVLIGLASSGAHSNGYSLIRKIFSMTEDSLSQWIEAGDARQRQVHELQIRDFERVPLYAGRRVYLRPGGRVLSPCAAAPRPSCPAVPNQQILCEPFGHQPELQRR